MPSVSPQNVTQAPGRLESRGGIPPDSASDGADDDFITK